MKNNSGFFLNLTTILVVLSVSIYGMIKVNSWQGNLKDESNRYSNFNGIVKNYTITDSLNLILEDENFVNCTYYNYSSNYTLMNNVGKEELGNSKKCSRKHNECFNRKHFDFRTLNRLFIFFFVTSIFSFATSFTLIVFYKN